MEIIKLNLIPSGVSPTCYCSQYDNGRVIRVDLFDGLTPYELQSGDVVTLNVRKPDNTIIVATLSATQGNTYVNIETTEQMCAVVGFNLCDLTITNGSKVIGTLNFIMSVERDVLADGIPSESVIEDLEALVQEAVGDNFYTKTETDDALALKADKSTTYTKTEVDTALNAKASASVVNDINNNLNNIIEDSKNLLSHNSKTTTVLSTTVNYSDGEIKVTGTANGSGGRTNNISDPITLPAGKYTLSAFNGVTYIFLEKTSDNSIITNVAGGNGWKSTFELSNDTEVYIGINVDNGVTYDFTCQVQIEKGENKTGFSKPSNISAIDKTLRSKFNNFWSYAMDKILCIGDSLTSGACFSGGWNGASIDQNYPRLLGRMLSGSTTNAGVSGITAQNWYKNEISKYTLSNFDTFIIWLGTNGGLTDSLDTDVTPYNDYHDYADTNTGNYCKIIEEIKTAKSDCFIVLTKIFSTSGSMGVATTNAVIDKIATKYNLPVVDNSDLSVVNYPVLHGNINNPHFTKTGNLFIANRYMHELSNLFENNPSITNFGLSARTN